jgi:hypothetical protein
MASSFSSDLKLEIMNTGENAGQWGNITNSNLIVLQQAIAGYQSITLNGTTGATLVFSDGVVSDGKNAVLNLAGTLTSSVNVIVPDAGYGTAPEKVYILKNATSGAFAVTFKTTSGTGATFAAADKGHKLVYSDGTNIIDVPLGVPGGSDKQIQFNNAGSFGGITMGTAGQVLQTDGTTASFADPSGGGTSWQAVQSGNFNASAGEGYFVNTSGGAITATLPASPTIGQTIKFIDYAGTFDTNNLTVGRNGKNIQGLAENLTVNQERAGLALVFTDNTQGWLLETN